MALITCPKCGKQFSDRAEKCPQCGVSEEALHQIPDSAFQGYMGLIAVTIGEGVTHIGKNAFLGCYNLTSASVSNSVSSIGEDAFKGCKNLQIRLPERFKGITDLSDCKSVTYY